MNGAVAAGHPLTAQAGAEVLRAGGNAVDAAVAASLASWVAESPLTGPGGGGFMLVHLAKDGRTRVLDFFVAVPGLGRARSLETAEMDAVDVDFSGGSTQVFRIGPASVAVPGAALGLEEAHRCYGRLPWADLFPPAVELAREGVELTRQQAYLHAILDVILRQYPEGRRIYGKGGDRLAAGDVLRLPELADSMETIARAGARVLYEGELAGEIVRCVEAGGGLLTRRDLAEFRVVRRRPVEAEFRDAVVRSNPPPSSGGVLIGYGLQILDRIGLGGPPGSAGALARLIEALREQNRARDDAFNRGLRRGGLAQRLYATESLERAWARVHAGREVVNGTTHISVVDAEGNAAALSVSTGSGSGVIVPGTGIQLNNMLGEFDLNGADRAGDRMTSMMSPTIALVGGAPRLVVGSAGSLRLRGAVFQVLVNVLGHRLEVPEAIEAPRVHAEADVVHCEGGFEAEALDELAGMGYALSRWRRRNLFFGGAAAVGLTPEGDLSAAGDPRRGGHGIVVE